MTASPRDDRVHTLGDSAHFEALPSSPLEAYTLGMLRMLQRTSIAVDCAASATQAMEESNVMTTQVLAFLNDIHVPQSEKHALVATIERATDVDVVQRVLRLHAIADGVTTVTEEASNQSNTITKTSDDITTTTHIAHDEATDSCRSSECIPEALGCAICCDELMLKPVSLLCGHSFCKRCVDMWLKSCANCPTCRQPVGSPASAVAVNVALHDLMESLYPEKLHQLEARHEQERLDHLRALISQSIASGQSIRELIAQQSQLRDGEPHPTQADVSHVLENDPTLQQQVLAAEIRERLRKEKALREESRRRHIVAYCGALPAASRAHVQMIHSATAAPAPIPIPSVQSHRPVKKYVPPAPKKSPFFASLLRR